MIGLPGDSAESAMTAAALYDSVTVFGGATLDRLAATYGPPVMGASNPGSVRRSPGGVGFNLASVLARLGTPTRLVSRVGADSDGEAIVAAARGAGIDTTALAVSLSAPTAGYHATFDDTGNLVIGVADMKVCDEITPAAIATLAVSRGDGAFWAVDANLPEETLVFLAEEAHTTGTPLAAMTVSPAKALRLLPVLDRLTILFANRREAAALLGLDASGKRKVADLAVALSKPRAAHIVVTDGGDPLAVAHGGEVRAFAPRRADVKGVNGAGDTLAAGTIHALSVGADFHTAVRRGLSAAVMTLEAGGVIAAPFVPGILAKGDEEAGT